MARARRPGTDTDVDVRGRASDPAGGAGGGSRAGRGSSGALEVMGSTVSTAPASLWRR